MSALTATSPLPSAIPQQLDGRQLSRLLRVGCQRVIAQREELNRINVFPVPDGDTGSNLGFTLRAVMSGLRGWRQAHAGELLRVVAERAIDGARGNSGAIMAQFLQGVAEASESAATLNSQRLASAAHMGSEQARLAMSEPREGTILSVINAFAGELQSQVNQGVSDLKTLFDAALVSSQRALAATPSQLAVLREAGVVDAGAQGFVDLLEGIADFLQHGRRSVRQNQRRVAEELNGVMADAGSYEESQAHRYCTECLISADGVDRQALRAAIHALDASSLVIAGTRNKMRLHAHVNEPEALFRAAARFGKVSARKADDMWAQTRSTSRAARVAIVTDSAADIPDAEIERLNIHVVPVRLSFGAEDFLDKVSLSPQQFYERLRTTPEPPQTSQPPPGDFRRQYEFLLAHHERVVSVHLSRVLSGTLQSAESAAERIAGARTQVFDARNASTGLGLMAMYAAEAAAADCSEDEILRLLEHMRPLTRTFAVIPDLSHGVRGGRIPPLVRFVANVLRLTPMVHANAQGRLAAAGGLFGRRRIPERFATRVARRLPREGALKLLIGHCDNPVGADVVRRTLGRLLPACGPIDIVAAGSAIAAHAGPGTLVIGAQPLIAPRELLDRLARG